jgi:xanthine dehydrogenase accessory factor
MSITQKIAELETSKQKAAVVTVVQTKGSTPRKIGAKMVVLADASIYGTIGGGALEKAIIQDAVAIINGNKKEGISHHALVNDHGMCCGGQVDVFIERIVNQKKLYIFGAGHIGKYLAKIATELHFAVTVIDERTDLANEIDNNITVINKNHNRAFKDLIFDNETFICVTTHDHAYDREIIAHCANQPNAYLGMIGSQRKIEIAKKIFRAGNIVSDKAMEHINWPMGINIKSNTPEEIVISILAKLIDVRAELS